MVNITHLPVSKRRHDEQLAKDWFERHLDTRSSFQHYTGLVDKVMGTSP